MFNHYNQSLRPGSKDLSADGRRDDSRTSNNHQHTELAVTALQSTDRNLHNVSTAGNQQKHVHSADNHENTEFTATTDRNPTAGNQQKHVHSANNHQNTEFTAATDRNQLTSAASNQQKHVHSDANHENIEFTAATDRNQLTVSTANGGCN